MTSLIETEVSSIGSRLIQVLCPGAARRWRTCVAWRRRTCEAWLRRMGHTVRRGGGGALSCLVTAYLSDDDGRRETCESFMLPQKHQKEHLQIKISCYN